MTRFWDLWTLRFASWMIYMLGLLFASGLCCTCFSSGLLSNYGFNYLHRISGYFQGPAGVRLPTWHLPTCEVEKRVAAFLDFGVTACNAAWVYFTSVYLFWQVEFMGLLPLTWVYCLWHGFTAFDMGLLFLTWSYFLSNSGQKYVCSYAFCL